MIPGGIDLKQSNSSTGIISELRVNYERYIGLFPGFGFFRVCRVVFGREKRKAKPALSALRFWKRFSLCVRSAVGDVGSVALHSTGFCPCRCIAESCKFYCLKI